MIFFPYKDIVNTPDEINLKYEEVFIAIENNQNLHGWFVEPTDPEIRLSDKVILFCHGNAGNISRRLTTLDFLTSMGLKVLIFDYPTYGKSEGELSESGVIRSAELYYNWLINEKKYKPENIVIFGRSLGGAVGIDLATKVPCRGLIVESSFTSVADIGNKIFPIFPIKLLLKYEFDSASKIKDVNCPLLITHSPDDDIIPYQMGLKLYENAVEPKKFLKISGLHNELSSFNSPDYINTLKQFIGIAD